MPTKTDHATKPRASKAPRRGKSAPAAPINKLSDSNTSVPAVDVSDDQTISDATIADLSSGARASKASRAKTTVAPATNKAKKDGASRLSGEQLNHFQTLLVSERARLEEEREQIRSRSGSVDGALPEEGEGGDEDTADLASAMMDKEMDLSVEDEIEDLLAAVDHALQKIEAGTYGVCDMSGETIPASRLELIPWAALTVECQALAEGQ